MSMPAIERVIPLVGQLPAAIREALARRLRELAGLSLIALSGVAGGGVSAGGGANPNPTPSPSPPRPQLRRLAGGARRGLADADTRSRRHHADPADRGVGLADAD